MEKISEIIANFKKKHILVVGDIMLDKYIFGEISRINPEAPVPILNVKKKETRLGGAANVANNIVSLGGNCTLIGRVGKDDAKKELTKKLKEKNIEYYFIEDKKTTIKTRIIAKKQQTIRIDEEIKEKITDKEVDLILKYIDTKNFDLILITDYNKGIVTPYLINKLKSLNKKIIADPKPKNIELFTEIFAITPNIDQAKEIVKKEEIEEIGKNMLKKLRTNVIITRGEKGVSLFEKNTKKHHYIPSKTNEVSDVSGAGDTFVSAFALAIANNLNLYESTLLGNQAAGIVVGKLGTATTSSEELEKSFNMQESKIKELTELGKIITTLKKNGKKIIFTSGCFDIIHAGHIKLLKEAKKKGDILILGLNTDKSIKKIKGKLRPINKEEDRSEVLASLSAINYIILFDEDNPSNLISKIKPDIYVKGQDYSPIDYKKMPEARIIYEYGGKIELIDSIKNISTTSIIKKLK